MSADHWILTALLIVIVWILGRMRRDERAIAESVAAIMHGQEHIADILAEIRRMRP